MKHVLSLFILVSTLLLTACSGKNKDAQQVDDPFSAGAPNMPAAPQSVQLAAGEALYSGTANLTNSGSLTILFVLSADKKEIRDLNVNINGLNYTINRGNTTSTVSVGSIRRVYYMKYPVGSSTTDLVFEKSKISGLTFTPNGASGTLTFVYIHKDNSNLSAADVDIPLGSANIDFKIIEKK